VGDHPIIGGGGESQKGRKWGRAREFCIRWIEGGHLGGDPVGGEGCSGADGRGNTCITRVFGGERQRIVSSEGCSPNGRLGGLTHHTINARNTLSITGGGVQRRGESVGSST